LLHLAEHLDVPLRERNSLLLASGYAPVYRETPLADDAMSPIRHLEWLNAPVVITYGSGDTPEFRRQSQAFFAALRQAGKPAELVEGAGLGHMEMLESLADPAGINGRALLGMMGLTASPAVRAAP